VGGVELWLNTRWNGCYNCSLTCRDEYWKNDYPPYSLAQPFSGHFWLRIIEKERGKYPKVKVAHTPLLCMHCEDPPCANAAQNNAVYKRIQKVNSSVADFAYMNFNRN
jgi:Fe-S-cluster-containing dehydrogenase component